MSKKVCTKCGEVKPLESFSKAKTGKHGRRAFCKSCGVAASIAWQKANPEKKRARQAKWYSENTKLARAAIEKWRKENPEKQQMATKAWGVRNRDRRAATLAKRRAGKLKRTPKWLTKEDFEVMAFIYEMARVLTEETGVPHHVDHEIPLQGYLVSGLHVPSNLQILTACENMSKRNHWVVE